jgi:hypothetical protein
VLLALATVLIAPLPSCDRGDEAPPPIVVVTPEPVRGVIAETTFSDYAPGLWVAVPIQVSDRGKLDVTVNWTFNLTWMYVYIGAIECDFVALSSGSCPFLVESETKDPKPRVLETEILDPDTYYIFLYNVPWDFTTRIGSNNTETVEMVIGLTVGLDEQGGGAPAVRLGRPTVVSPPQL